MKKYENQNSLAIVVFLLLFLLWSLIVINLSYGYEDNFKYYEIIDQYQFLETNQ